jgi:hypothetical protein
LKTVSLDVGIQGMNRPAILMIEYLITLCLLLLTIGHGLLVKGCMTWTKESRQTSRTIDDRIATLATLLDEGLDILSGGAGSEPVHSVVPDLKSTLMSLVYDRMMGAEPHGSTQGPQGPIQKENDTPQEETEV